MFHLILIFISFFTGQGDHGAALRGARASPDLRGVGGDVAAEPAGGRPDGPRGDDVPAAGRVRVQ